MKQSRAGTQRDIMDDSLDAEWVRNLLRGVTSPGTQRNIIAAGFVKDVDVNGIDVTVHFAPDLRSEEKIAKIETAIREVLGGVASIGQVDIQRHHPYLDRDATNGGSEPSPAEILERREVSGSAQSERKMQRPDLAPEAGYGGEGPQAPAGPSGDAYDGELPVFQWEIDPQVADAKSGTADIRLGEWEFRMWWQVHPSGLVYASIQAMLEDEVAHEGAARSHPVGRTEAVNLVYDTERKAVVAIYGTVRDFRPFVDAFYRCYVLKN